MSERLTFTGFSGEPLAALLDKPVGEPAAYALFAHCFTCSKDIFAAKTIAKALTEEGFAVLRFDFTGLGHSEGEFANTNFSSNIADLVAAANAMRARWQAPGLLIGHSLGGAAVIMARRLIPEVKAVATIGAPADAAHVMHHFADHVDTIQKHGAMQVSLAGRPFTITKQFLDDLGEHKVTEAARHLNAALLVMHAPRDETVSIDNAGQLFLSARHPKSFISLDDASHLLSRKSDALYAARVIASWAFRYCLQNQAMPKEQKRTDQSDYNAVLEETGDHLFHNHVETAGHHLIADEPIEAGGGGKGPSPYDFLSVALAACTSMTLRIYARHKGLNLPKISVKVRHQKIEKDALPHNNETRHSGPVDQFIRQISFADDLPEGIDMNKIAEIANKCPVHKTLSRANMIETKVDRT
jgi:uncharacterized OsmC-like protein/pimeloyl-ACP methyl ester carboxylesterase